MIYCGEWIESHVLHIYMLHAPDFLGYEDSVQMAKDHPQIVERGLQLKKVGNDIVRVLGGRDIHPINVRVGGFYRLPTTSELEGLKESLKWAREAALETVRWSGDLPFPDFQQGYTFVALQHPEEYPFNEGRIVASSGLDIPVQEYDQHFTEEQVQHSNALHSTLKEVGPYLTGPLARYNLNYDRLGSLAREAAADAGLQPVCLNPFQSIVVRSVEVLQVCDEAIRLIEEYQPPEEPFIPAPVRAGIGYGCTEAPRGILYHRYQIDDEGLITDAKIVPPTSQNQLRMESDLWEFVPDRLDLSKEQLTWQCEQLLRSYDPCISCATHFLDLTMDRE